MGAELPYGFESYCDRAFWQTQAQLGFWRFLRDFKIDDSRESEESSLRCIVVSVRIWSLLKIKNQLHRRFES